MRLPVLEENYVTFKLINQDNKNQLLSENSIIDKPISILDLMRLICSSEGIGVYTSDGSVACFMLFNPEFIFGDNKLFMFDFIDFKNNTRIYFVSAKSYSDAFNIYTRVTNIYLIKQLKYEAEVVPVNVVKGE